MGKNTKAAGRSLKSERALAAYDPEADAQRRLIDAQASIDRDYTRLRELETRYRYLLHSSSDAILMFEAAGRRIVDANPAACHRLSTSSAALVGSSIKSIVGADGEAVLTRRLDALLAGADSHPFNLILADGSSATAVASLFRQDGAQVFMLHLDAPGGRAKPPIPTKTHGGSTGGTKR